MRIRDLLTSGVCLVVAMVHFGLQWHGWKLHVEGIPLADPLLGSPGDSLWSVCSFPLFALLPRRVQTLHFFELLITNSVLWGVVVSWGSGLALRVLSRRGRRDRVDQSVRPIDAVVEPAAPPRTRIDQLVELKKLLDERLVTSEEYLRQRAAILTGPSPAPVLVGARTGSNACPPARSVEYGTLPHTQRERTRMVAVNSTMLPLGTPAPDFHLPDTDGKTVSLSDFASAPAFLVMFICNHCPYVKHIRDGVAAFAREYQARGLAIVAISSNDAARYPDDSPEKMAEEEKQAGYTFPYLYDASQEMAKAYHAACTPDFFLFDRDRRLVYRGQFDDSRPGNSRPVTGADMRAAADAALAAKAVPGPQRPSIGCNIKWKPGNAPDYFSV